MFKGAEKQVDCAFDPQAIAMAEDSAMKRIGIMLHPRSVLAFVDREYIPDAGCSHEQLKHCERSTEIG